MAMNEVLLGSSYLKDRLAHCSEGSKVEGEPGA